MAHRDLKVISKQLLSNSAQVSTTPSPKLSWNNRDSFVRILQAESSRSKGHTFDVLGDLLPWLKVGILSMFTHS